MSISPTLSFKQLWAAPEVRWQIHASYAASCIQLTDAPLWQAIPLVIAVSIPSAYACYTMALFAAGKISIVFLTLDFSAVPGLY